MSRRNGDRARFQINRKRKLRRRQRVRALVAAPLKVRDGQAVTLDGGQGSEEPRRESATGPDPLVAVHHA